MSDTEKQFNVVAVGASAGGLHAVKTLLGAFPPLTRSAFLLAQHPDMAPDGMPVELLYGETALKVVQPTDGTALEAGHLYVNPPGVSMKVTGGAIQLTAFDERHAARLPFDELLKSLSQGYGARAVAVVLSGTGTDGAEGSLAIARAGGLVLIQDPQEAELDVMPRNAIARSSRSKVLPIADIAEHILDYAPLPETDVPDEMHSYDSEIIAAVIELLNTDAPGDFSLYKRVTLERCVAKRLAMRGIPNQGVEEYLALLRRSAEERRSLANDLFVNVTCFFRDRKAFDFIRDVTIPEILDRVQGDTVRVWVAGCSTGEEAYSLGVLFLDHIESRRLDVKLQIFASDADADAVAVAREGSYAADAVAAVPSALLEVYFIRDKHGYRVNPQLRGSVVFTVQNVLTDPPFSRLDMVSCRNLLIYLRPEAQAKAFDVFSFSLLEGGFLFLGQAETVGLRDERFKLVSMSERVFRRVGTRAAGDSRYGTDTGDVKQHGGLGRFGTASRQNRLADLVSQAFLRYAPAAILVNRRYEYVYSAGPAWQFLHIAPGIASLDIFAITPRSLHDSIRSAILGARKTLKPFAVHGAKLEVEGIRQQVSVHVELLSSRDEEFYLICFLDTPHDDRKILHVGTGAIDARRVRELEEMQRDPQDAAYSLKVADEQHKILTARALSLTEELVTSREELQSLNEELKVLNDQLHEALEHQRAVSNDLQNVLFSTDVPTLFLDGELNIRFFTAATRQLFNIIPADVGRPLSDLSMLVDDVTLRADALAAITNHETVDKEISARNGRWYIRRIKPYRTEQGHTEGVVITFIDTSAQKRISEDQEAAKKSAELASEAKSHFLAAASHDLRQPLQTLKLLHGLLEETVESYQARVFVKRMEDTLSSMSGILDTILDINQVEVGMVEPKPESFCIADILERLRKEFSFQALDKGLELKVMPCSIAVQTDPRLLEQVLRNLMSNALKYTQTGKVLVGCRNRGRKIRLEVWDTGIGIPADQISDIFDEYHQLDVPVGSRGQGLGLGLSIVKRMSDLLGLNVTACSEPGKGSVFSIEIGRAVVGQWLVPLPAAPSIGSRREKAAATVLVIEDEAPMRSLLSLGLEQVGHIVTATASAAEALGVIRAGKFTPQIILADYNLGPGMDGLAAIGEIRRMLGRQIPALVLTGNISSHALEKYEQYRVPHLNKPAKLRDIVEAIDDLLAYRRDRHAKAVKAVVKADEFAHPLIDIIDDDRGVRETMKDIFSGAGWVVDTYATAEDYLARYNAERISCLLVDAYLPGMGGLDLMRVLVGRGHRFPVILITGRSDVPLAVEAMKQGAADFIEKPFSAEEIITVVREAFKVPRNTNERSERSRHAQAVLGRLTQRQRQILERICLCLCVRRPRTACACLLRSEQACAGCSWPSYAKAETDPGEDRCRPTEQDHCSRDEYQSTDGRKPQGLHHAADPLDLSPRAASPGRCGGRMISVSVETLFLECHGVEASRVLPERRDTRLEMTLIRRNLSGRLRR